MVEGYICQNMNVMPGNKTDASTAFWLYLLWLVSCAVSVVDADCVIHKHDSTKSENYENEKNLLKILKPLIGERRSVKDDKYTYTVGICTTADLVSAPHESGMMQYSSSNNYSLGSYTDVGLMGGHNWVLLTYYNGSKYSTQCNKTNRASRIMVVCDPTVFMSELRVLEERLSSDVNECFYLFEISSNVTCKSPPPPSLSSGSVFCIIIFTSAGIYLLLGFLYQRIVVGAKGLEQIPNYAFWRSFGNLQADGCDYICRCGPRQESQAYRGIDDRIRTDEERDDQLLNM